MQSVAVLLAVIVVLVAVVVLRSSRVRTDTVQKRDGPGRIFSDTETGKLLGAYMTEIYEENGDRRTDNLNRLKQDPGSAFEELDLAYGALPARDHRARWGVVYVATMLESAVTLQFLEKIIEAQSPDDAPRGPHRFSAVQAELTIRIRAVEGVRLLAVAGEREARTQLLRHVRSPHFCVRKAAALGLLGLDDGETFRKQVADLLPDEEHFVFDLEEARVDEAGVIKRPATGGVAPAASPAPDFTREGAVTTESARGNPRGYI